MTNAAGSKRHVLPGKAPGGHGLGVCLIALACLLLLAAPGHAQTASEPPGANQPEVRVMDLRGAIGPAVSDGFVRALEDANRAGAALFVLRLDTPGGLDKSMRTMIQAILRSQVPVATYVSPSGSRAASAGTYLLYASHVAAMAPATNLGAATPVQLGGGGAPSPAGDEAEPQADDNPDDNPDDNASALRRKQVNDAVAYIRGLAELRGRNADWAERAVREAVSLTAAEAEAQQVIDLVAPDIDTLLAELDGFTVRDGDTERALVLKDYRLVELERDWRTHFLAVITDPSIAYILMLVGIYGLILEFSNPGFGLPGVLGAICLLLALYALQMLPVSYVGLGLILLGIGLMVAEGLSPSFGVLGVGGAVALVIGSIMLMDTDLPAFQIAIPVIAAVGVGSLALTGLTVRLAFKAHARPVVTGGDTLIGQDAVAADDFGSDGSGQVRAAGELWRATSDQAVRQDETVTIHRRDGLTLHVSRKGDKS
jgi:membrane-bound serine protease (ClpP class)